RVLAEPQTDDAAARTGQRTALLVVAKRAVAPLAVALPDAEGDRQQEPGGEAGQHQPGNDQKDRHHVLPPRSRSSRGRSAAFRSEAPEEHGLSTHPGGRLSHYAL